MVEAPSACTSHRRTLTKAVGWSTSKSSSIRGWPKISSGSANAGPVNVRPKASSPRWSRGDSGSGPPMFDQNGVQLP